MRLTLELSIFAVILGLSIATMGNMSIKTSDIEAIILDINGQPKEAPHMIAAEKAK